jgi:hypothetical protein
MLSQEHSTLEGDSMYGRRAYGPHKKVSDARKAKDVAVSILTRTKEGRPWSFSDYGLVGNEPMLELVRQALVVLAA